MVRNITIRINILTNFLIVVGLISAMLLALQYYFSQKMALEATHKTFRQIGEKITLYMQESDSAAKEMLYHTELYPGITDAVNEKLPLETIRRYAHNMERNNNIYSTYVGHANGDLFALFLRSGIPGQYAKAYLSPEQNDEVDVGAYLS